MKVNVIATGSSGNLYELIDKDGNSMLIEAGMPRQTYMKNRVGEKPPEMCIISHEHFDHAHYKADFEAVIPTHFKCEKNVSEHWKAFGMPAKHGEIQVMTFLIKSLTENKFVYFATDLEFGDYVNIFKILKGHNVENFIIECNYNDYLYHLATDEQRRGCDRHLSDNDVIRFIKSVNPKNTKLILIHGSNRLCADTYTKKYISGKLPSAKVDVAVGVKNGVKNLFIL